MAKELTYRIFVGDRPWETLTQEEREKFGRQCAERMGAVMNDWFSTHPEEYKKI